MEYRQFKNMLRDPEQLNRDAQQSLQELLTDFPYFQSAHLLLAKSMHRQEHIRFDKQIKKAAIYAGDRKVLFKLIHTSGNGSPAKVSAETNVPENPFILEEESTVTNITADASQVSENPFVEASSQAGAVPVSRNMEAESQTEEQKEETETVVYTPVYREENIHPVQQEQIIEEPVLSSDPREILKRRLEELLGKSDETEKKSAVTSNEVEKEEVTEKVHRQEKTEPLNNPAEELKNPPMEYVQQISEETVFEETSISEKVNLKPEIYSEEKIIESKEESEAPVSNPDPADLIDEEASKHLKPIEKIEFEYALEESILQSLENLPVLKKEEIEEQEQVQEQTTLSPHSFTEWLQTRSKGGFGTFEEVHADDEQNAGTKNTEAVKPEPGIIPEIKAEEPAGQIHSEEQKERPEAAGREEQKQKEELINKFIITEPRIVPSKAEFYSPATQAKRSIEEHEDLVSETLAAIYKAQGNILKARTCYEKLGLLHPEKSRYFAALVREIDEQLNQSNQEDL